MTGKFGNTGSSSAAGSTADTACILFTSLMRGRCRQSSNSTPVRVSRGWEGNKPHRATWTQLSGYLLTASRLSNRVQRLNTASHSGYGGKQSGWHQTLRGCSSHPAAQDVRRTSRQHFRVGWAVNLTYANVLYSAI